LVQVRCEHFDALGQSFVAPCEPLKSVIDGHVTYYKRLGILPAE
jgi:hypothetical protein